MDDTPLDRDLIGARKAASVLVLRDGAAGLEVLMLRRAERAGDARSGIWVFPGGVLDAVDADPRLQARCLGDDEAAASARLGLPQGGLAYAVAALRECFEEVGLLFAEGAVEGALAEQARTVSGEDFVALCERHGLRLQLDRFHYHSHWLTPPGSPKRFDTRFFAARAPAGQPAVADGGEAQELAWLTPAQALDPAAGRKLLHVTRRTLEDLARFADVDACLAEAAARRHPPRMMPRLGRGPQGVRPVGPEEWAHAEIGKLDPEGRGDVWIDLQPLRPVRLSPRVARVTCANGSMMTGPGTNSYLVGEPGAAEVAVIDPGPSDAATEDHLQALIAAAAPARITRIFVTHTHKDHSPAALRLQALTGARLIGRVAAHPMWQDTSFQPEHAPQDDERFELGPTTTLQALATPGHASNHICWWLEQEQLLFTGDHVMQGSTVVINPPDGDMAAYLASLAQLLARPAGEIEWFAPGHGFLMARPQDEMRRLIAHRLQREAKVAAALAQAGPSSVEALVPSVYGDVPPARHAMAARSLTAHLLKLQADGRALQAADGVWRPQG
ncbi:MAG TPA: MBL fold metallo-hydrolase [Ideonella sp.]|nr:MBL fold metallo-hydrolase [Ideonella sp.]